ncbi:MAG: DUF1800 domain-containing protein [Ahniella sp.]|nr:DUF1800 domain-containing protein [Ahniella sp.]
MSVRPFQFLFLAGLTLGGLALSASVRAQEVIFGGNGANFEDRFTSPESDSEAARFLTQATFGPNPGSMSSLRGQGFANWFAQQQAIPVTSSRTHLDTLGAAGVSLGQNQRIDRWFHTAALGNDQLRQRMAFALSQILVISDQVDTLSGDHLGTAEYWDILARNSLGNYRQLLEEVTRSPMMGRYLTHFRNRKSNPSGSIQPDENYAREIMQLFTIGLVERNLDFSPILDVGNNPLPTYRQEDITQLARVFTGWSYACAASQTTCDTYRGLTTGTNAAPNGYQPMACFPAFMDDGAKTLFDNAIQLPAAGVTCGTLNGNPVGSDNTGTPADVNVQNTCRNYCQNQLENTLDVLFNHPNVAPFVSRQLIQRLVTSNPSPAYIQRVATVFENNGSGVRGDLAAVAKAILLDEEARIAPVDPAAGYGKVREPLLKLTAVWRALGVTAPAATAQGEIQMGIRSPQTPLLQRPLGAPTVFNFYEPDYKQPGAVAAANLFSPEFQIANETTLITAGTEMWNRIFAGYTSGSGASTLPTTTAYLSFANLSALAATSDNAVARGQLLDAMNTRLLYGTMSPHLRTVLDNMLRFDLVTLSPNQKVLDVAHFIAISPEFAVQR